MTFNPTAQHKAAAALYSSKVAVKNRNNGHKGTDMKTARHPGASPVKSLLCVATSILLLCSLGVSAAELYRWTDARGVVHYTDKPPRGVNAERVSNKPVFNLANPRPEETTTSDQPANPDAERCQAERNRLSILQSNKRVQMENRDGTVRELSDSEIQQEIEFSQRAVERFCNPQPAAD